VTDLTNGSWYGNYSYWYAGNASYYVNDTYCYNGGTPSCHNVTVGITNGYGYGHNSAGWGTWTFSGSNAITMWTNGTNMVATHKFVLIIALSQSHSAYVQRYNLLAAWAAGASASTNMATLGNGASLNSITIA
jgi:hypothetical protein